MVTKEEIYAPLAQPRANQNEISGLIRLYIDEGTDFGKFIVKNNRSWSWQALDAYFARALADGDLVAQGIVGLIDKLYPAYRNYLLTLLRGKV